MGIAMFASPHFLNPKRALGWHPTRRGLNSTVVSLSVGGGTPAVVASGRVAEGGRLESSSRAISAPRFGSNEGQRLDFRNAPLDRGPSSPIDESTLLSLGAGR
jgi:hypothetical protein